MNVILNLSTAIQQFSFNYQSVGQHRLIEKLFLMKYNEREYYQHQCDYFFISFPTAWRSVVIPCTWYSSFVIRQHFSQFPFECKKKIKKEFFPFVAKNTTGQRRYCHAVVSSCAIKHFYFQKLRGYSIMLGFMDLMWPRVFRRSNVGLVGEAMFILEVISMVQICTR